MRTEERQVNVIRCYVGHLMTSLDAGGVQASLLRLDRLLSSEWDEPVDWLQALDAATDAMGWPRPLLHADDFGQRMTRPAGDGDDGGQSTAAPAGVVLSGHQEQAVRLALQAAADALEQQVDWLNQLDSGCGDGDCGSTFQCWVQAFRAWADQLNYDRPWTLLQQLSELTEAHVGGTTGALYGLFFAAASHLFRVRLLVRSTPTTFID